MVIAVGTLGVLIDAPSTATAEEAECEIRSVVGRYLQGDCVVAAALYPRPVVLVSCSGGQIAFPPLGDGHITAIEITDSHELVIAQMDASLSVLPLPDIASSQPRKIDTVEVVASCVALQSTDGSNKVICGMLSNKLFIVDLDDEVETTCICLPHDGPVLGMQLLGRPSGDSVLFIDQAGWFSCINVVEDTVEKIEPKDSDGNVLSGAVYVLVSKNGPVFGLAESRDADLLEAHDAEGLAELRGAASLHLYAPSQPQSRPLVSIPLVGDGKVATATLIGDGGFVLCCYHSQQSDAPFRSRVVLQTAMGNDNMVVQEFPFEDKVLELTALPVPSDSDDSEWSICALVRTLQTIYTVKMSVSHLNTVLEALCVDLVDTEEFLSVVKLCNALDFDFDQVILGAGHQALNHTLCSGRYAGLGPALKVWKQRRNPIPLTDLRDVFGFISQWPSEMEEVCEQSTLILELLTVHWHNVVPRVPAVSTGDIEKHVGRPSIDETWSPGGTNPRDDSALALWFITVLVLLLTCEAGSTLSDWRLWIDSQIRKSVKNLNLLEPYVRRTPVSFDSFERIISKDFATFQHSLLPEETCFRHWMRQYLNIAYDQLPAITDLHTRLDVAWPDTILGVSVVAIVEDSPLEHALSLLQCLWARHAVLYVCTFALLSRQHDAAQLAAIEKAVTAGSDSQNNKQLADGSLLLGLPDDFSYAGGQVETSMEWDLQAALFDDKWDGVRLMDLLDEAPTSGTWGFLCMTLLKARPELWDLQWSTRFRLYLCTCFPQAL